MTGPASQTTGRCTVSFVPTESPLDIFLHEGVGQFRRVGLKESAEGFRQEVVQVSRAALGNERPCLGGERCGQLSFDSDPFHAGRIAGGTEGSKLMRTGGRRDIMLSYWRARRRASGGETRRLGVLIAEAIWRLFNQPAVVALLRQPAPATAGRDKAAYWRLVRHYCQQGNPQAVLDEAVAHPVGPGVVVRGRRRRRDRRQVRPQARPGGAPGRRSCSRRARSTRSSSSGCRCVCSRSVCWRLGCRRGGPFGSSQRSPCGASRLWPSADDRLARLEHPGAAECSSDCVRPTEPFVLDVLGFRLPP